MPERRVPQLELGNRIPTFRALLDGIITVPSDSETDVTWGMWENGDTRFFSENTVGSPARVETIDQLQAGVFALTCSLFYGTAFSASRHVIWLDDYVQDPLISIKAVHFGSTAADQFSYGDTLSAIRGFPVFTSDAVSGLAGRIAIKANQSSGVSRDLTDGLLEVYYIGHFSVLSEEP